MNRSGKVCQYDAHDLDGNLIASGSASFMADVLGLSCSHVRNVAIEKKIVKTRHGLVIITRGKAKEDEEV